MKRFLFLLVLTIAPEAAHACDCAWPGRPCRAFAETTAIFSGRVVHIGEIKTEQGYTERLVRFDVMQGFKGTSGATADVITGYGGGDCGFDFKLGEEYMVYARSWEKSKRLYTGVCTRTRNLSEAGEDLAYFRKKDDPKLGKGILGQVETLRREPKNSTHTEWDGWLKDAPITVTRGGQRWETTTDNEGQFGIWGLAPGTYRLETQVPPGYVGGIIEQVEIKKGTVCSEVRILTLPEWKPPPNSVPKQETIGNIRGLPRCGVGRQAYFFGDLFLRPARTRGLGWRLARANDR